MAETELRSFLLAHHQSPQGDKGRMLNQAVNLAQSLNKLPMVKAGIISQECGDCGSFFVQEPCKACGGTLGQWSCHTCNPCRVAICKDCCMQSTPPAMPVRTTASSFLTRKDTLLQVALDTAVNVDLGAVVATLVHFRYMDDNAADMLLGLPPRPEGSPISVSESPSKRTRH